MHLALTPMDKLFAMLTRATIPFGAHVTLVLALVAGAGMIRGVLFSGYVGLDDGEYARFAYLLANGRPFPADYSGPGVFPLRVGVYGPAALMIRLFGSSEWALVLYPFLLSLAAIALVYVCAAALFGWQAGVIAAGLLSILELDIDNSTMLLPDLPAAFFAAAGVTLIAVLLHRRTTDRSSLLRGGLAAGLAFGLAWLCKESVVYLVPLCAVLIVVTIRGPGVSALFLWGGVAASSLAILSGEMLVHWLITGDPLLRLHQVERNYRQWENGFFTAGSNLGWAAGTSYRDALIDRLFVSGPTRILLDRALLYTPLIGLAGAAYGWARRDRAFLIPGLWLLSLVLMFNFASSSATSYTPLPLYYRYLYLMYVPAIVLTSALLAKAVFLPAPKDGTLLGVRPVVLLARAGGVAVAGFVVWTAALNVYYGLSGRAAWISEARALHETVKPDTVVYADALTLRALEFFAGYPSKTAWTDFRHLSSSDDILPGSLVIVNTRYIEWLDRNAGMWVTWPQPGPTPRAGYRKHAFYDRGPGSWTEVWKNENTRVYSVSRASAARQNDARTNGEER